MDIEQLRLIRDFLGELTTEDTDRIIEENGLSIDAKEVDDALDSLYIELIERIGREQEAVG